MCGLAGQAWIAGQRGDSHVRRMMHAVAHRGPDEAVELALDDVTLGFARLSLVDPAGGGQPLSTPEGDLHVIANGEIYNHHELEAGLRSGASMRTGSDCEVLLHLYRERDDRFLDDVRGMFAAVLYDSRRRRLVFARDKFGIKPLFFHRNDRRVVFASEIKALLVDPETPRTLDWERCLGDQLMTSEPALDIGPAHAWFQDICLVPAGCIMTIDLDDGRLATHRYWDFPEWEPDYAQTAGGFVERYRDALAASVTECGMADVEIGLLLSGGIDSAAVARLARTPPRSFTAVNASILANGDAQGADAIARALGLSHHSVVFPAADVPSAAAWRRHLWLQETPLAGPESYLKSELYRYVKARAPEIKAMYLGGGADEFNGGYTGTLAEGGNWDDFVRNITGMAWRGGCGGQKRYAAWLDYGPAPLIRSEAFSGGATSPLEYFHRWKYRDVQQYNCWHEDRSAAGSGIEARVPFLDSRLIDIVAAIPEKLAPELLWDKQILRRAMAGLLPEEIRSRPKTPFFYGAGVGSTYRMLSRMLLQDDGELLEEALAARGASDVIDAANARLMLAQLEQDPSSELVEFALRVVNLGLLQSMADSPPPALVDWLPGPVPERIELHDWAASQEQLERAVMDAWTASPDDVLALSERVLLVRGVGADAPYFLTIDASIEYIIDAAQDPDWLQFLLLVDGTRSLGETLAAAGVALPGISSTLRQALGEGIIVRVESAGAAG
jgi:asparagine synthase (glutamine-hydrolysing)